MQPSPSLAPPQPVAASLRPIPGGARLPLWLYRSLFPLAFFAMLPGFARRMLRRGNYRHKFGQRFGIYSRRSEESLALGGWTWIHAVSVGEMVMAIRLARVLEQQRPGLRILLSTTTSTGFALARGEVARLRQEFKGRRAHGVSHGEADSIPEGAIELIYFPLDFSLITQRVLRLVRPEQVILVDKEFWPNLLTECYRRGIPVSIVNAMLSPRSERRFLKWRRWTAPFFAMLDKVCVQQPEDVARWQALGVRPEALECTGSLKFDFATFAAGSNDFPQRLLEAWGVRGTPVLLGGSTFAGEEELLVEVWRRLRVDYPTLFLILVPRHAERRGEVVAMLRQQEVRFACRRDLRMESGRVDRVETEAGELVAAPEVLLVDTTGELRDWYRQSTLCFIGKSLSVSGRGGQNPAEPILVGRPVLFGPQMQNFSALVRQLLAADGATQVRSVEELEGALRRLLADPSSGEAQVKRARAVLAVHEGANERVAKRLLQLSAEKTASWQK